MRGAPPRPPQPPFHEVFYEVFILVYAKNFLDLLPLLVVKLGMSKNTPFKLLEQQTTLLVQSMRVTLS